MGIQPTVCAQSIVWQQRIIDRIPHRVGAERREQPEGFIGIIEVLDLGNGIDRAGCARSIHAHIHHEDTVALTNDFSERRWLLALDAVDAVASGSYSVPLACARATAVFPLSAADARAHCVIYDLAFVEISL